MAHSDDNNKVDKDDGKKPCEKFIDNDTLPPDSVKESVEKQKIGPGQNTKDLKSEQDDDWGSEDPMGNENDEITHRFGGYEQENLDALRAQILNNTADIDYFVEHQLPLIEENDARIGDHRDELEKLDDEIEQLVTELYTLKSAQRYKPILRNPLHRIFGNMENMSDVYSFIMIRPWSRAALLAWFTFFLQIASFLLSVSYLYLDSNDDSEKNGSSDLNLPKGVDMSVHAGQGIAIFLIVLVQQSLWEATAYLAIGYKDSLKRQGIPFRWWLVSNLLRLIEGLVATFVTFILILKSENVVDLFKDFTAMTFVSSFDDIVYILAKMKVIGVYMEQIVDECEKIILIDSHDQLQNSKSAQVGKFAQIKKFLFRPVVLVSTLLVAMYIIWAEILVIPHINGDYLCQSLYLQLDGRVNSQLPYFSGSYELVKGDGRNNFQPIYREKKLSLQDQNRNVMNLRYCNSIGSWVFTFEEKGDIDQCDFDNLLIKTATIANQQKYDVLDISTDDWFVRHEDRRWMPLEEIRITCQDIKPKYNIDSSNLCEKIEIDEREGQFVNTRSWSTEFTLLRHNSDNNAIKLYDRPVYISSKSNDAQDLILFVGKRWIITSSSDLEDYDKHKNDSVEKMDLNSYIENRFHGKWSDYNAAFFSEPVLVDTPQDSMSPTGLKWFASSPKVKNEIQVADENKETKSLFLCSYCNSLSNPCFYEGICGSDQTCNCTSGSSGTLCQVLPTSNGLCDQYFNSREFHYDGGDCCINTCESTENYLCGKDKSGKLYVGYDKCETDSCVDCWKASKPSASFKQLVVTQVSFSKNGLVLALIEWTSQSVQVYDNDGSNWIKRGISVTDVLFPEFDSVKISGDEFSISNKGILPQVTVAVNSNATLGIYDWKNSGWENGTDGISKQALDEVQYMELHDNGNYLGVLYNDRSFGLFQRPHHSISWEEVGNNKNKFYDYFSMSEDGTKYVLANQTCFEVKTFHYCFEKENVIKEIKISSEGKIIAVLVDYDGLKGAVFRFRFNTKLERMDVELRGVMSEDASIEISNDGMTVAAHSSVDNMLRFHQWENGAWKMKKQEIEGKSMSFSAHHTSLAMISSTQSSKFQSSGSVVVYHMRNKCEEGMSTVRLTFITDNSPRDLLWEIVSVTSAGNVTVLEKGGPYKREQSMFVKECCVENLIINSTNQKNGGRNIGIKIFDLGLDGLKNPGSFGISVDGIVKMNVNNTDGYMDIFPIFGNASIINALKNHNPWNTTSGPSLINDCLMIECKWEAVGRHNYNFSFDVAGEFLSMSSDGSVVAVGNVFAEKFKNPVRVFSYNHDGGWTQRDINVTKLNQTSNKFYNSVSLSADGSIIAVGDPGVDTNALGGGQVRMYIFDKNQRKWSQLGNNINGSDPNIGLGFSVSLSADGNVVAVGMLSEIGSTCQARVYQRDAKRDEWIQRGVCLGSTEKESYSKIELSSNGFVIAIGSQHYSQNETSSGIVKVFEYDPFTEGWKKRGKTIYGDGKFHLLGNSLSLSADGSILALCGSAFYRAIVYKYHSTQKQWQQLGQNITAADVTYFNYFSVELSSSGLVMIISHNDKVQVLLYDQKSNLWIYSMAKFPLIDYLDDGPVIAVSADASIVALKARGTIELYRLTSSSIKSFASCQKNQHFFEFIIKSDMFPQDISWSLKDEIGDIVVGGRLPDNKWNGNLPKLLTFTRCLPHNDVIYMFYIEDKYGDGICCNWGHGYFDLKWNNIEVLDDTNFLTNKTLCLPPSSESCNKYHH